MAYAINYNDEQFKKVEADRSQAIAENNQLYDGMIGQSDKYYQDQINATKEWGEKQQQLQQEQTDFTIEQIEQQKEQTTKDYTREQSGAYADWQKESNRYGANAEQMASQGLANTGYSESSQVSMYNQYQNRVAIARESYNTAIQNYNNSITEARLQNNSIMAEIAYNTLQQSLELSLQGFQYKNSLLMAKADSNMQIQSRFDGKYQAVLDQMNTENALQEQVRQFNSNFSLQQQRLKEEIRQYDEAMAEQKRQNSASAIQKSTASYSKKSTGNSTSSGSSSSKIHSGGGKSIDSSTKSYEVNSEYYQGSLNSDAKKYGTFSNGYQPKGISGHGKLTKTGKTIANTTKTLAGQSRTVEQNVWKAADGTLWYWEGRQNKYLPINS